METKKWFKVKHKYLPTPIRLIRFPSHTVFLFVTIFFALFITSAHA
jgi:hypothetical protein